MGFCGHGDNYKEGCKACDSRKNAPPLPPTFQKIIDEHKANLNKLNKTKDQFEVKIVNGVEIIEMPVSIMCQWLFNLYAAKGFLGDIKLNYDNGGRTSETLMYVEDCIEDLIDIIGEERFGQFNPSDGEPPNQ